MKYWLPLKAQEQVKHSLPRHENKQKWSVNKSLSGILDNPAGDWLQLVIHKVLPAFIGKSEIETLPAPS
jgi:hypothetical protein